MVQKAAEARKHQIQEADQSRMKNEALTDLELEARGRAQRLVERADALKMEQEEEIKILNQVGANCRYIHISPTVPETFY